MKFFILSTVVDVVIAIGASKELKSPVSAFAGKILNPMRYKTKGK